MKAFKNKKEINGHSGFTLIELIIVIALIVIFTLMTLPLGIDFYQEQMLEGETTKLAENLKIAQSRSRTAREDSSWGIAFNQPEEGYYTLFRGGSYEVGEDYEIFEIERNVEIVSEIEEVVFQKNTGRPIINPVY